MRWRWIIAAKRIFFDAFGHFNNDDGWAMASHLAMSTLLAVFPFLIFVAAVASQFGAENLAEVAAEMLFEAWPQEVAEPVARDIHNVLTTPRGDLVTIGVVLAIWFASNGVEALRTALNRAYRMADHRNFLLLRLQSIVVVLIGALGMLALAFLVVLAPLLWATAMKYAPWLEPFSNTANLTRFAAAAVILLVGLAASHKLLPAGSRRFVDLAPGILFTLVLWLLAGSIFGFYLERFANYASTYAGLASVMTVLIFLYLVAVAIILGGELNAAIMRFRAARAAVRPSES